MFRRIGIHGEVPCAPCEFPGKGAGEDIFDPDAWVIEFGLMACGDERLFVIGMAYEFAQAAAEFFQREILDQDIRTRELSLIGLGLADDLV